MNPWLFHDEENKRFAELLSHDSLHHKIHGPHWHIDYLSYLSVEQEFCDPRL
jgi:hypothetical protein